MSRGRDIDRRRRAALAALRRPETVVPFHGRFRTDDKSRRDLSTAHEERPAASSERRLSVGESLLMVAAALRVVLPYLLVLLVAVLAVWGVWRLLFH
ncbi:MAG: hypothetical protein ACOC8L_12525 [Spirochaetota bacterium]